MKNEFMKSVSGLTGDQGASQDWAAQNPYVNSVELLDFIQNPQVRKAAEEATHTLHLVMLTRDGVLCGAVMPKTMLIAQKLVAGASEEDFFDLVNHRLFVDDLQKGTIPLMPEAQEAPVTSLLFDHKLSPIMGMVNMAYVRENLEVDANAQCLFKASQKNAFKQGLENWDQRLSDVQERLFAAQEKINTLNKGGDLPILSYLTQDNFISSVNRQVEAINHSISSGNHGFSRFVRFAKARGFESDTGSAPSSEL